MSKTESAKSVSESKMPRLQDDNKDAGRKQTHRVSPVTVVATVDDDRHYDSSSSSNSSSSSSPEASPPCIRKAGVSSSLGNDPACRVPATSSTNKLVLKRQGSSSLHEATIQLSAGLIVSGLVILFSLSFPFILAPELAHEAYQIAYWTYDPAISEFDNTAWTYGTDYILAICMIRSALAIRGGPNTNPDSATAIWRSRGLLLMYMCSVIAGGLAHQFFHTIESQNSVAFRIIWIICVGFVSAASALMGSAGTEYLRYYTTTIHESNCNYPPSSCWIIPEWFWVGYTTLTTLVVALGYFSFQDPASDIFVAGITQFPSTFYMIYILLLGLPTTTVRTLTLQQRIVGSLGFILNAPLLPLYPILVKYFTLPVVNTFLHSWLLCAWTLQCITMQNIVRSIEELTLSTSKSSSSTTSTSTTTVLLNRQQQTTKKHL